MGCRLDCAWRLKEDQTPNGAGRVQGIHVDLQLDFGRYTADYEPRFPWFGPRFTCRHDQNSNLSNLLFIK